MKRLMTVTMCLALVVPVLFAQEDGQRPQRPGRGERPERGERIQRGGGDMERGMQNLRAMMVGRQVEQFADRLKPLTVSDRAELKLTEDQKQKVIALEQAHAARLEEFKGTAEKVQELLKEARQLQRDEQNRAMVPEKLKRIQSLAEPIAAANVEFAAQLAGVLSAEQLTASGVDNLLMENFPWSQTLAARWLITQEMDPEKRKAVIEAIRSSDEALLVKLDTLLTEQQLAQLQEQMQRSQQMAAMMGRMGRGGRPGQGGQRPGGQAGGMLDQAMEKLNLDEKQKTQVQEVLARTREEFQKLREAPQDERREKMREVLQKQTDELKKILTEEQLKQFQEAMQQLRGGRGGREGGQAGPRQGGRGGRQGGREGRGGNNNQE